MKPAPPVDPELPKDEEYVPNPADFNFPEYNRDAVKAQAADVAGSGGGAPKLIVPDEFKEHIQIEMDEIPDDEPIGGVSHDEL